MEPEKMRLPESGEILGRIHAHLTAWRAEGPDARLPAALQEEFRALTDRAATAGLNEIAELSHSAERLLARRGATADADDVGLLSLLEETYDGLAADLGLAPSVSPGHVNFLNGMMRSLLSGGAADEVDVPAAEESAPESEPEPESESKHDAPPPAAQESPAALIGPRQLTRLINASGELAIAGARARKILKATYQDINTLRADLRQLRTGLHKFAEDAGGPSADGQSWRESRELAGNLDDLTDTENDPPAQYKIHDLTKNLDDLADVESALATHVAQLRGALAEEFYLGEGLRAGLLRARLRPAGDGLANLRRVAGEAAEREGKAVEVSLDGGDVEVDRRMFEAMRAPLEELIRNSIAHGIETAERREAAGKPAAGRISLSIARQADELLVEYADDGAGLAREKIAAIAARAGATEAGSPLGTDAAGDAQLLQLITQPFGAAGSAAMDADVDADAEAELTSGMHRVLCAVRELGGAMAMRSRNGEGVRFQFRLPAPAAVSRALLVRAGEYHLAIPAHAVERLLRVKDEQMTLIGGREYIANNEGEGESDGARIPVIDLAARIGDSSRRGRRDALLVVIRLADRVAAFEVDEFAEVVNIAKANAGAQPASIRGVAGVAVLEDGRLASLLDPEAFVSRGLREGGVQSEALLRFPLGGGLLESEAGAGQGPEADSELAPGTDTDSPTLRVAVLETAAGPLIIPAGIVAEIVGVTAPQTSMQAQRWVSGDILWRGYRVPLVDTDAAFGAEKHEQHRRQHQQGGQAVILWPLKGGAPDAFFALSSLAPPKVVSIDARSLGISEASEASAPSAPDSPQQTQLTNLLCQFQFHHRTALIPDLQSLARQIFRSPGQDPWHRKPATPETSNPPHPEP